MFSVSDVYVYHLLQHINISVSCSHSIFMYFCVILTINSDYFPQKHFFSSGDYFEVGIPFLYILVFISCSLTET